MVLLMSLLACSGSYNLEGKVTDGLTGAPMGGLTLIARADDKSITLSCQTLQGSVADDGSITLQGLCGGSSYTVEVKGDVVIPELATVPDGGPGGPLNVKGYVAPGGDGLYVLADGKLEALATNADVAKEVPLGATDPVYYPTTTPGKFPILAGGQFLVMSGEATSVPVRTLEVNGERLEVENGRPLQPWFYVGHTFEGNTPTKVEVAVDQAKVTEITVGDRPVRYLAADAVPAGRYALFTDGDRRMALVDVGGPADLKLPSPDEGKGAKGKAKGKGKKR